MRGAEGIDTVAALLAQGAGALRAAGLEGARLDAEVLLAFALGVERAWLLSHPTGAPRPAQRAAFEQLVARRARGEPVAYLAGRRAWYDLALRVTPAVLVPRPETEGLLERALDWTRGREVLALVDVGTGSGALAIALARALPATTVYATDLSADALEVARTNAAENGAMAIRFLQGDLLAALLENVDLIVANLPYIGEEEYAGLVPDVRLYEPRQALVGGAGGHELLARLLGDAPCYLRPGGAIMAELGPHQADAAASAAQHAFPEADIRMERDYAGLARYLLVLT